MCGLFPSAANKDLSNLHSALTRIYPDESGLWSGAEQVNAKFTPNKSFVMLRNVCTMVRSYDVSRFYDDEVSSLNGAV